jgi:penicillin-binding protein 1C
MSGATMRGASGITGAGPLFHRAMTLAMAGLERPAPLFDEALLESHKVCALSGDRPGPDCPATAAERFVPGTAPRQACKMHGPGGLDLGPRFYDWAAHEGLATLNTARGGGARAALLFPGEGDEYLRDRDLPDPFQTIPVRALAPEGGGLLELQLDDGPKEELAAPYSTRVPAAPGRHVLRLYRRGAGEPDARVRFVVRG